MLALSVALHGQAPSAVTVIRAGRLGPTRGEE
jgi:hypothetical protein